MSLIRPCRRFAATLALAGLLLAGCQPEPPAPALGGGARPAKVVEAMAQRLQANDLEGYVRTAVPADMIPKLEAAWSKGSRWPLTELPFDDRLPSMLAALAADGSEARFQALFEHEFAGAQDDIRTAALSLGLFGMQYLSTEGDFSDHQREHYIQLVQALSQWAATAPLADSARAGQAITQLTASARKTGLTSEAQFAKAGMFGSLRQLAPFVAAFKRSLTAYGLDIDHALAGVRAGLIDQTGDTARVRVRYRLAGQDIDTIVEVERREGRWYPSQALAHAEAALAAASRAAAPAEAASTPSPAIAPTAPATAP